MLKQTMKLQPSSPPENIYELDEEQLAICEARHHDPFSVLGRHTSAGQTVIRVFAPQSESLTLKKTGAKFKRLGSSDMFEWRGNNADLDAHYELERRDDYGHVHYFYDPYVFPPLIDDFDLHLFCHGKHLHIYNILGAHLLEVDGITGVRFATWAPNASRVSVMGDFNQWDGRCHPMRSRGNSGVWELFIPGLKVDELYKYEIRNCDSGQVVAKTDPYAQQMELRPHTASVVSDNTYPWLDASWLSQRESFDWLHQPMSIYELHLGSWQRGVHGEFLNYRDLAERLVTYVKKLGFTHIELLPVTEHPLDDSWGYQTTGYFAPTCRFGTADDFRYFVDYCHQHDIGVFLDWVPAHFPRDEHALAQYDGGALYEHANPMRGEHPDWGTLIYDYGSNEVCNFLLSSAIFWLKEFHIDGLRVDAVASMLYLDYSRENDSWEPNIHGNNENLEAIEFLINLNIATHREFPGTVIMAEESSTWPGVTRPTDTGGLGFSMKWNMGWMHDSLEYMAHEPVHRSYHHNKLTFGLLYSFTENFVLSFSHDEVVHGKASMLNKMPGDEWQRFANLRLLYTYMFTYPGKKLLFMGCEFGQPSEWAFGEQLEWDVLDNPNHQGIQKLVGDLNMLYRQEKTLHHYEFNQQGFEWIDCHDAPRSVISYLRKCDDDFLIVVLNFTPVPRHDYRIGVPQSGRYREIFNSDSTHYAGSNLGNPGEFDSEDIPYMNRPCSLSLTLPPLTGIILKRN
jgi:1,4-alpha-glucan branching enzyme